MKADPSQKANVIDKHPKVAAKMLDAYEKWWTETRPLMVNELAPVYEGKQPFVKGYEDQLKTRGIPQWKPPRI